MKKVLYFGTYCMTYQKVSSNHYVDEELGQKQLKVKLQYMHPL